MNHNKKNKFPFFNTNLSSKEKHAIHTDTNTPNKISQPLKLNLLHDSNSVKQTVKIRETIIQLGVLNIIHSLMISSSPRFQESLSPDLTIDQITRKMELLESYLSAKIDSYTTHYSMLPVDSVKNAKLSFSHIEEDIKGQVHMIKCFPTSKWKHYCINKNPAYSNLYSLIIMDYDHNFICVTIDEDALSIIISYDKENSKSTLEDIQQFVYTFLKGNKILVSCEEEEYVSSSKKDIKHTTTTPNQPVSLDLIFPLGIAFLNHISQYEVPTDYLAAADNTHVMPYKVIISYTDPIETKEKNALYDAGKMKIDRPSSEILEPITSLFHCHNNMIHALPIQIMRCLSESIQRKLSAFAKQFDPYFDTEARLCTMINKLTASMTEMQSFMETGEIFSAIHNDLASFISAVQMSLEAAERTSDEQEELTSDKDKGNVPLEQLSLSQKQSLPCEQVLQSALSRED